MKRRNVKTSKRLTGGRDPYVDQGAIAENGNFDISTFRRLDVSNAPDLTRRIMGRLGYMSVSPRIARRQRLRSWMNRSAIALTAVIALGIGFQFYQGSPDLRRPVEVTIPAAIGQDLRQHRERIGGVINVIRNLSNTVVERRNPPVDEDAVENPQAIDDDLRQPVAAPFRWV